MILDRLFEILLVLRVMDYDKWLLRFNELFVKCVLADHLSSCHFNGLDTTAWLIWLLELDFEFNSMLLILG